MSQQQSGELSQFEQLSAMTPKKMPLAIIAGTLLIPILLVIINMLIPNEAVDEAKANAQTAEAPAEAQPAGEVDEI